MAEFVITRFIDDPPYFVERSESLRFITSTSEGLRIVFWGGVEDGTRNIDALHHQKLPVMIDLDPIECIPSDMDRKYGADLSVPSGAYVTIVPDL